jgi:hypothetical protein
MSQQVRTKERLDVLVNLFVGQKWTDVGPLSLYQPNYENKRINKEDLFEALDELIEEE